MTSIRRSRTTVILVLLLTLTWLVFRSNLGWLLHPSAARTDANPADKVSPSPFQPGLIEFWDATSRALIDAKPDCSLPTEAVEAPLSEFASLKKGFDFRPDLLQIPRQDVDRMRDAHARFVSRIPDLAPELPYERGTQGIVVAASGALLPVFLVSLKMLRRTGSTLPVEVFMEAKKDYEKEICETVLPPMNATCMILSEVLEAVPQRLQMSKYQLKALALAFSSFEDVLLLDADNLPVEQPEHFLNSEPFASKGFVSWPDCVRMNRPPDLITSSQADKCRSGPTQPPPNSTKSPNSPSPPPHHGRRRKRASCSCQRANTHPPYCSRYTTTATDPATTTGSCPKAPPSPATGTRTKKPTSPPPWG